MLLYLILLRVGFSMPRLLPAARCALTAPFHPYRVLKEPGGIFSAALSVGSHLPGITWHPALWSPDFPPFYLHKTAAARPTLREIIQNFCLACVLNQVMLITQRLIMVIKKSGIQLAFSTLGKNKSANVKTRNEN